MPGLRARLTRPVALAVALALAGLATAAAAAGLLVAARVRSGDDEPARLRDHRITIAMDDYLFDPQLVRGRAGRITVTAVNRGRLPHTLRLLRGGRAWLTVTTLKPGGRRTVAATLPRGRYRMVCAIANHEDLGMWGIVVLD
jgi:plastocyanin